MTTLTEYEKRQLAAIEAWKNEQPGVIRRTVGVVIAPFVWLVDMVVPDAAVQGAINAASELGRRLIDTDALLRDAQVPDVASLRNKDLSLCDRFADDVHNWAIGVAVAEGSAAGTFGILSAPIDVPAIITLAMRTIHQIGVCYGYECNTDEEQLFARRILAVAGANTLEEKVAAFGVLTTIRVVLVRQTWKAMVKHVAQRQLGAGMVLLPVYDLAKQIGISLIKRRAMAAIPVTGAMLGGAANGWYIKEVGWAARRSFQEKWLADAGKLTPEDVSP